jgi:hypothetical protein
MAVPVLTYGSVNMVTKRYEWRKGGGFWFQEYDSLSLIIRQRTKNVHKKFKFGKCGYCYNVIWFILVRHIRARV